MLPKSWGAADDAIVQVRHNYAIATLLITLMLDLRVSWLENMRMERTPAILAAKSLPYGRAEIIEWDWPKPIDMVVRETQHMIEMSLPPFSADGVCSFPTVDPTRFRYMGSLFIRPAGVDLRARSVGGKIRVVRLAVDPDAGGRANALALDEDHLGDGLDLRETGPRMLLSRMRDELVRPGADSEALLRAYADALLIEISRGLAARRAQPRSQARLAGWQYARVLRRIEADGPPPSSTELADLCGISVRHFARLYRGLTGESPARSIERARVKKAIALLGEDDIAIKLVADRLGFAHNSAFTTSFRRATGVSPSTWRQRQRAGDAATRATTH